MPTAGASWKSGCIDLFAFPKPLTFPIQSPRWKERQSQNPGLRRLLLLAEVSLQSSGG